MASGLEVNAHPTGPWLVRAGRGVFAVPARIGQALLPWQADPCDPATLRDLPPPQGTDPAAWRAFLAALQEEVAECCGARPRGPRAPVWLRLPLIPAPVVAALAKPLSPLTGGRGLLGLTGLGGIGYAVAGPDLVQHPIPVSAVTVALALIVFCLTAVWHELGHAAAVARAGYPPGRIGAGLLFVIPVLFADVTAVGLLPRRDRVRVDLAGVVFHLGAGGILAGLAAVAGLRAVAGVAALLVLAAVAWSLFPFVRSDGYWLLCDLLGLEDLEVDPDPAPGGWRRLFLRTYRLANAIFLVFIGVALPLRAVRLASGLLAETGRGLPSSGWLILAAIPFVVLLGFAWWNLARRVLVLVRAALR